MAQTNNPVQFKAAFPFMIRIKIAYFHEFLTNMFLVGILNNMWVLFLQSIWTQVLYLFILFL